MDICYLLESTQLCGGVRIAFDQARALSRLGHRVSIRAKSGNHEWYNSPLQVSYVDDLAADFELGQKPDVVIATFWTTVRPAMALNCKQVFHLCQGYEADFEEYSELSGEIEAVYRMPVPKITIGLWLDQRLREVYGSGFFAIYCVGQIVDYGTFRPQFNPVRLFLRRLFGLPVRVLVVGNYSVSVKAIPVALMAVAKLREAGQLVHLTRVASEPLSEEESAVTRIQSYHVSVKPNRLASLYRQSDLLLAPSNDKEGFGLPFAEALASGIPCVVTAIPSFLGFDKSDDYAVFVPQNDPGAMATAAYKLLRDPVSLSLLRRRGPQVIRQNYSADKVAQALDQVFLESVKS